MKRTAMVGVLAVVAGLATAQSGGAGADPLYRSTGDQKRSYKFSPTGEMLPYRTYVPTTWKPGMHLPMVVVLHGGGLTDDAPFERTPAPMKNELQTMAEQYGFIVVAPMCFSEFYGIVPKAPGGEPTAGVKREPGQPVPVYKGNDLNPHAREYSEQDTMTVIGMVEQEYGVDTTNEFLTGNSMGGSQTTSLAVKYPDKWTAIAPSESGFDPAKYGDANFKVKGALLIHKKEGNAPTVETQAAEMIGKLKSQGVDAREVSLPDTVHETVWFYALPLTFHFFDSFVHPPVERAGPPAK